jgi:hypothetical protein
VEWQPQRPAGIWGLRQPQLARHQYTSSPVCWLLCLARLLCPAQCLQYSKGSLGFTCPPHCIAGRAVAPARRSSLRSAPKQDCQGVCPWRLQAQLPCAATVCSIAPGAVGNKVKVPRDLRGAVLATWVMGSSTACGHPSGQAGVTSKPTGPSGNLTCAALAKVYGLTCKSLSAQAAPCPAAAVTKLLASVSAGTPAGQPCNPGCWVLNLALTPGPPARKKYQPLGDRGSGLISRTGQTMLARPSCQFICTIKLA